MQRRDVNVGDATISTAVAGDGPPLVLVPGLTMSIERWVEAGYVEPLVSAGRRVILIDPLGHGRSSKSAAPGDYTEDRLIAHLVGVLDANGLDQADVWGYSRGAQMAGSLARIAPDRVRRLVYGGNVLFDPAPVLAALDMAPDPAELERAFERSLAGDWELSGLGGAQGAQLLELSGHSASHIAYSLSSLAGVLGSLSAPVARRDETRHRAAQRPRLHRRSSPCCGAVAGRLDASARGANPCDLGRRRDLP